MQFGKWKERVYMAISNSVAIKNEECLQWIQQVENAKSVEYLRETEPFTSCDTKLAKILDDKMHGLTGTLYLSMKNRYMELGRRVKGRRMLWLLFQNYQVDHATLALHKSKQLRELQLHKNLPAFLNAWQEHVASMEQPPSESELLLLFTDQVRNFKPMAETWKYLDQGM